MPKIIIDDQDLTTSAGSVNSSYAVFVPGFAGNGGSGILAEDGPILFESVASFKAKVGSSPLNLNLPDVTYDLSYIYACELLGAGLPIVYQIIADDTSSFTSITDICDAIKSLDILGAADRGSFDVSFVTTGGYPTVYRKAIVDGSATTYSIEDNIGKLQGVAEKRGDCFAVVDVDDSIKLPLSVTNNDSLIPSNLNVDDADAFAIVPGATVSPNFVSVTNADNKPLILPGSFHFLKAYANSIRTNEPWFAIAGVRRGLVQGIPAYSITNDEADELQPDSGEGNVTSVNAITLIKPYGRCIWGNRTLRSNADGMKASSYINVRQLVHEIKRHLYKTAKALMFSPNDDILWVNFKNNVTPLLDRMLSGQGISSYRLIKVASTAKATLTAKIVIAPIEAVENFELTVILTDEGAETEG